MFDLVDDQVTDKRLDDNGTKAENLTAEPRDIIAYVLDFRQAQLYHVGPKEAALRHLTNTLIRNDIDRVVPKNEVIRENDKPDNEAGNRKQKQFKVILPNKWWNT